MTEAQTTHKPLSSAEASRLLSETRTQMAAATAAGDIERHRALAIDADFYAAAAETAREREAVEADAARWASIESKREEASVWLAKSEPRNALAPQCDKIERGLSLIFEAIAEIPAALEGLAFARARADALAPEANLPPPVKHPVTPTTLRPLVLARAQAAYLASGLPEMPEPQRRSLRDLFPSFPIGAAIIGGYAQLVAGEARFIGRS